MNSKDPVEVHEVQSDEQLIETPRKVIYTQVPSPKQLAFMASRRKVLMPLNENLESFEFVNESSGSGSVENNGKENVAKLLPIPNILQKPSVSLSLSLADRIKLNMRKRCDKLISKSSNQNMVVAQKTVGKTKKKFVCEKCSRVYVKECYYASHVAQCGVESPKVKFESLKTVTKPKV